jgi:hypothetical protein
MSEKTGKEVEERQRKEKKTKLGGEKKALWVRLGETRKSNSSSTSNTEEFACLGASV